MSIAPYLKAMVEHQASDLYFSAGAPVGIKIEGVTKPIGDKPLQLGAVKTLAYGLMNDEQVARFEREWELDMAFTEPDLGRFRVNVFRQRGEVAMVLRYIRDRIPSIEELHLPPVLKDLVMEPRGLVFVVGTTGSGKSTTLASMIDYRNQRRSGHILTIEDPVEYLHSHKQSIVNQREVGFDTHSYEEALRRAMREAPDVIMIGEIRDRATMEQALMYAETGHLCLSTVHATNANQTLERVVNFFPDTAREALLHDLSLNLRAVIAQRLLVGSNGRRVPAVELLRATLFVQELIQQGKVAEIKGAMEQGTEVGMSTFDQSLYELYRRDRISLDTALQHADSPNNLGLKIRLESSGGVDTANIPED